MKIVTTILGLTALAGAQFNYDDWRAPASGDLRSPCPVLNALANHGFLPRDGRNILRRNEPQTWRICSHKPHVVTQGVLIKATSAVNLSTEVTVGLFLAALKTSSDPASGAFTLQDLKKHNIIEHDGSLSRADTGTPGAGDQEFNRDVFNEFKSFFKGATQISLPLAAAARWARVKSAHKSNPNFLYGPSQRFNSYAETSIYFQLLLDPNKGTVPLEWLEIVFCEERLPAREGWKTPSSINGLGTGGVLLKLAMATDEKDADIVLPGTGNVISHPA
ncbi:chloroperoxidase-like protein [Paraphaeosphaeria sporulosa]